MRISDWSSDVCSSDLAAISPDHPLAERLAKDSPELAAFIELCRRQGTAAEQIDTADKLGFDTGIAVEHPLDPDWHLPVWVVNYVLMDYGTGAIFGCPAHDLRDLDFAHKYEIGRASWRERVGQYCLISAVDIT